MVRGHYKRFSFDRQLENFEAIGEGLIGGFGGWISGTGAAGVSEGFSQGYRDSRSWNKARKKWLRKSVIGSASNVYGSTPWSRPGTVYGSNPRPPIYGSPPEGPLPLPAQKAHFAGIPTIAHLVPFKGRYRG